MSNRAGRQYRPARFIVSALSTVSRKCRPSRIESPALYRHGRRRLLDGYGNELRYRAKVDDAKGAKAGRWAWDVFRVVGR